MMTEENANKNARKGKTNTQNIRTDKNDTNTNFRRVEERGAIVGFLTGLAFVAWIGYFSFLLLFIQLLNPHMKL